MKVKIISFLIVSMLLSCSTILATDLTSTKDSLMQKLQSAQTPQDSLPILYHLLDVSTQSDKPAYCKYIYDVAQSTYNVKVQLDVLRTVCNIFLESDSIMAICQKTAEKLPVSNDQRETITFIKINRIASQVRTASEKAKMVALQKLISEYKQEKNMNLYDDILQLYYVCIYLGNSTTGELYIRYMEKLEKLIRQLPEDGSHILPNLFYTQSAIIYTNNEEHKKAIACDKQLLQIIEQLTARYASQGRIFRNYDASYYNCYRRILSNYPALSRIEIEDYYKRIQDICQKSTTAKFDFQSTGRPLIYYLMGTQQYAQALSELNKFILYPKNEPQKRQFLRLMIEASKGVGDNTTLLTATTEYNKLLEEYNQAKAAEKYKELQILYDVNELKSQNAQLELDKIDTELASNQKILRITLTALGVLIILLLILLLSYRRTNRLAKNLQRSKQKLQEEQEVILQTQKELTIARDEAESANKMKTLFIQNMSHEIRTPLNAIVGFSDILVESIPEEQKEEMKSYAEQISGNSELLLTLVGDVLDLAKMETGKMKPHLNPCSLHAICELVITNTRHRTQVGVSMYFNPESKKDFTLLTDATRLEQILINFLTNAAKFTAKGEIVLSYSIDETNQQVLFSVTDTGIGVPADKADIIFERFEKLDNFAQGTGLGLYICKLIARMLKGKVMLDTTYRKGARFIFVHPM